MQLTPTQTEMVDESKQRVFRAMYTQGDLICHVTYSGPLGTAEEVFLAKANAQAAQYFERMKTIPKPVSLDP